MQEDCACEEFIILVRRPRYPLTKEENATYTERRRIQMRVEHVFGRMSQMGMKTVWTIRLKRGPLHSILNNLAYNLDCCAFLIAERANQRKPVN